MSKRSRRVFSKEEKADAVALVHKSGKSIGTLARDLGIGENSLRNWVKQAAIDEGKGTDSGLTTAEREELRHLRREVKTLQMERAFLKKAAAFFAKETSERSN